VETEPKASGAGLGAEEAVLADNNAKAPEQCRDGSRGAGERASREPSVGLGRGRRGAGIEGGHTHGGFSFRNTDPCGPVTLRSLVAAAVGGARGKPWSLSLAPRGSSQTLAAGFPPSASASTPGLSRARQPEETVETARRQAS
jgi:hypothetical protein